MAATSEPTATTTSLGGPAIATHETRDSFASPPLDVTIYLPVVSGIEPTAAVAINRTIEEEVRSRVSAFRSGVVAAAPEDVGPASSFVASFEVTAATPEVLSIRFFESTYFQGAVSGNSGVYTQSFDPATGVGLALEDIIAQESHPKIAVLAELRLIDDLYLGDEAELRMHASEFTPDMLHHWNVSPTGVEISFDPGQVGAAYMGPLTVVIPYGDLAGMIPADSPAAELAAN